MSIREAGLSRPPIRLNTFERIQQDTDLSHIHVGKHGLPLYQLVPKERAPRLGGAAIKSIYSKQPASAQKIAALWVGKMGVAKSLERAKTDTFSWRSGNEGDMNEEVVKEKIGCDAYRLFGDGLFGTPKTRLSLQPIEDVYTQDEPAVQIYRGKEQLVAYSLEQGVHAVPLPGVLTHSLRVMSKWIKGYMDFTNIRVPDLKDETQSLSFMEHIEQYGVPSEHVVDPVSKKPIPIYGVMAVLAAASSLGDIDVFGGSGANCGLIFLRSSEGVVQGALVVKIDPGYVFSYPEDGSKSQRDAKDIPYSTQGGIIHWSGLTPNQKDEFLEVKRHILALNNEEILQYLFERKGAVWREGIARPPRFDEVIAEQKTKLQNHLAAELSLYQDSLEEYETRREEVILQKGHNANKQGDYDRAFNYFEKIIELQMSKSEVNRLDIATSYDNLGLILRKLGRHEEALKYQMQALELFKELLGERHPSVATSYNNVGGALGELGRHEEALTYKMQALELFKELLGERHPSVATIYSNVAMTLVELGQHEEALKYHMHALDLKKELLGERHPSVATSYGNVAVTLRAFGQHEEALKYQVQALELLKELLGAEHPTVIKIHDHVRSTRRALADRRSRQSQYGLGSELSTPLLDAHAINSNTSDTQCCSCTIS